MKKIDDRPDHSFVKLTKRQWEVLKLMHDTDEELVGSGRYWYVGYEKVGIKTVYALLRYVLISGWDSGRDACGALQYLHLNESGRGYLSGEEMIYTVNDRNGKLRKSSRF